MHSSILKESASNVRKWEVKMAKDPICGMDVDPKKAKFMLKKDGKDYYFCSKNCFEGEDSDGISENNGRCSNCSSITVCASN